MFIIVFYYMENVSIRKVQSYISMAHTSLFIGNFFCCVRKKTHIVKIKANFSYTKKCKEFSSSLHFSIIYFTYYM